LGVVSKGKRGRDEDGKIAVFELLKCGCNVYAVIILDVITDIFLPIIREKVDPECLAYRTTFNHIMRSMSTNFITC